MTTVAVWLLSLAVFYVGAQPIQTQKRVYECQRRSVGQADCRLKFDDGEFMAINDNGCFSHFSMTRNDTMENCPLQCQNSNDAAFVEAPESDECVMGESFGVERRRSDWFLWRRGECLRASAVFRVECRSVKVLQMGPESAEDVADVTSLSLDELQDQENAMLPMPPTSAEPIEAEMEEPSMQLLERVDGNAVGESAELVAASSSPPSPALVGPQLEDTAGDNDDLPQKADHQLVDTAGDNDDLPQKVDALLGLMFPSYRKKTAL